MSLQRRAPVLAVEAPEELHHLHDQLGPYVERRCFEQRLLGCGVEGRDLRDAVDQRLVVELRDRIPIDDIALPRRESLRSEEHTSELQSLMRISYAVFCLKKKKINNSKIQNSETKHVINSQ